MQPTLTIGISALNEEVNIKNLLNSLLVQKGDFNLEKIIVISDGSTDNTVSLAKSLGDNKILVIDGKTREGKAIRQNEICELAQSDILVILDADTLPEDEFFLSKLIEPIISDPEVGLVSGPDIPINPKNLFERTLAWGVSFKYDLFESISPDNIFLCVGADRAFRKSFYKKIHWPPGYPEDGFSYMSAIDMGYKFKYQKSARVVFRVPDNLKDHLRQSFRFINSSNRLKKYFDHNLVDSNYRIPRFLLLNKMIKYVVKNPFYAIMYMVIVTYPRIFRYKDTSADKWEIATSTKKLA